jgi:hypothetical protein
MTQESVIGPFGERVLRDEFRLQLTKLLRFVDCDAFAELAFATARQVIERIFRR